MLTVLLAAMAMGGVVPWSRGMLVAAIWEQPVASTLVLLGGALWARRQQRRQHSGGSIAAFHRLVAAELRAGRSLRLAVAGACRDIPELNLVEVARIAEAGSPLEEVAARMRRDTHMSAAATAIEVAAMTGGSVALVFDALTAEAVDDEALRLERQALTVQARLSVAIVGGFPLLVLAWQLLNGELGKLIGSGPVGAGLVAVGVALLAAGLVAVAWLIRRARH